jgi:ABC-2 type transport system permease protein
MNAPLLIRLECKRAFGGPGAPLALALLALAGFLALANGHRVVRDQMANIEAAPSLERQAHTVIRARHPDTGDALYHLPWFTAHVPGPLAPLALGLREVQPYQLRVRMLTLEGQLYESELTNPATLATGSFDLTFVLVFLYPLVLIALLHNLVSADREGGTWTLLLASTARPAQVILLRALVRGAAVIGVWLLTVAGAAVWLGLPLDSSLAGLLAASTAFLCFWVALATAVAAWGRTSDFNALALAGAWLLLTILLPAACNLAVSLAIPVPESLEVTLRQREGYHQQWDRPKQATMARFLARYPKFRDFRAPDDRFSWGWYYAMQQQGDEESAAASALLREKLDRRRRWIGHLAWLSPPLRTQLHLNTIAQTDLGSHLRYIDAVRAHHRRVREFFYPTLMRNDAAPPVDWSAAPSMLRLEPR